MKTHWVLGAIALAAPTCGCGSDGSSDTGSVQLFVEAEETIPEGLDPGSDLENIKDGWQVRYDKVLMTLGNVKASKSGSNASLSESTVYVLSMTELPGNGFPILEKSKVDAVRYDKLSYDNPVAKSSFERGPSVSKDEMALLVDNHWSLYLEGSIEKSDGESCTPGVADDCVEETNVHFAWGVDAGTSYTNCGPEEGDSGFAVSSGGTTSAALTIHGDHWFFNNFPEGAEITDRLAQWVADVDLDHDGEAAMEELQATDASDLFPSGAYSFSGSPISIDTAYDYVVAQSHTIGHFQGEGECEPEVL